MEKINVTLGSEKLTKEEILKKLLDLINSDITIENINIKETESNEGRVIEYVPYTPLTTPVNPWSPTTPVYPWDRFWYTSPICTGSTHSEKQPENGSER